jgi:hypothetical protein
MQTLFFFNVKDDVHVGAGLFTDLFNFHCAVKG